MSQTALSITVVVVLASAAAGWMIYVWLHRYWVDRMKSAAAEHIAAAQHLMNVIHAIPNEVISRNLRKGSVLLINEHINQAAKVLPKHPLLSNLRHQVAVLNKIPQMTPLAKARLRSKTVRQDAVTHLRRLAVEMQDALEEGWISDTDGNLAKQAAQFTADQLTVENARQAVKDAENVQSFAKALKLAHQARSYCRRLPPMLAEKTMNMLEADIERIQASLQASRTIERESPALRAELS